MGARLTSLSRLLLVVDILTGRRPGCIQFSHRAVNSGNVLRLVSLFEFAAAVSMADFWRPEPCHHIPSAVFCLENQAISSVQFVDLFPFGLIRGFIGAGFSLHLSTSSLLRPLPAQYGFLFLPVPLSLAVTWRIPLASISDHFNLGYAARGRRDAVEVENTQAFVVFAQRTFAL